MLYKALLGINAIFPQENIILISTNVALRFKNSKSLRFDFMAKESFTNFAPLTGRMNRILVISVHTFLGQEIPFQGFIKGI